MKLAREECFLGSAQKQIFEKNKPLTNSKATIG